MPVRLATVIIALVVAAPAFAQVEEQVITGSRLPQPLTGDGSARSIIDAADISASGLAYVSDMLRTLPGLAVSQVGGAGGLTQIRLRGAEANQVKVFIDGVEASPAGSGEFDFSSLLAEDVQRIELVRGAQSGVYGSNAMAGVIEITTMGKGASGLSASLEGGTYGTAGESGTARYSGDTGFLTLAAAHRASKGFSVAPGGAVRDGNRNFTVSARGSIDLSDRFSIEGNLRRADARVETDDQDFSGGPLQGQIIDSNAFSQTTDLTAGLKGVWRLAGGASVTTLSGTFGQSDASGFSGGDYGSRSTRRTLTLSSRYGFEAGGLGHQLLVFGESERETFRNTMPFDASQAATQRRDLWAIGAEYRLQAGEALTVSSALRHDVNDAFADATTFRLAGAYDLAAGHSRLHASVGTGVTNPTFFEQFGFLPSSFTGNPDLKPEKSTGWDAGVTQSLFGGDLSIDLTYFEATLKDEITPLYPSVVNATGQSRRNGLEATLTAHPTRNLKIDAAYTLVSAREADGSREVSRPRVSASLGLTWRPKDGRTNLHLGATYTGAQLNYDYRAGFTPIRTWLDDYLLVNAAVSYQVSPSLDLYSRVENLADASYQEVLGYASAGRAAFAGLRLRHGL